MPAQPVLPPFYANLAAVGMPCGTLLAPGGRIAAYVRATARADDPDHIRENRVASVQLAALRCRSGQPDIIVVLDGHTENIATADAWSNLKPGTKIVSAGIPGSTTNPTFTWTATAAQLLLDTANVAIIGCNLNFIGIDAVVLAISITAAGVVLEGNVITLESATSGVLKGIELAVGANGCRIRKNTFLSIGEAKPLTSAVVLISGACDDVELYDNDVTAANPGTSVLGHFAVTAAATNVRIRRNTFNQLETAGTALFCCTVGNVAATGDMSDNRAHIGTDVTATTSGFTVGAGALATFAMHENYCGDATARNSVLSPVAAA